MSITAASLIVAVRATGIDATEAALIGVGVAAGALIVTSAKLAANFQQAVNRLRTGGGDVQDSFAALSAGILKVSTDTGVLTPALTNAMYLIVSSGQRGAQAFTTLAAASQGAQIEMANVVDVTQILTTLQRNFGLSTYSAAQYMDGLVKAVSDGKISLENLSTAMSPILPNAKELGIHFADVAAAMSDMTNQGIPADQAATALRFVFQAMILPTKASTAAMKEWGLNSVQVAATMKKSLPDALQMYIDAARRAGPEGSKPFIDALAEMMGGGQRAAKALFSLSQSMGDWRAIIAQVNAAMKSGGSDVNGWAIAQSNFNVILDKAHAVFDAVMITIGAKLLPVLGQMVGWFASAAQYIGNFKDHAGVLVPILAGIGAILVAVLVPALVTLAGAALAASWPFLLIGAAVGGLVAIFMHFYSTSAGFKTFIETLAVGFKQVASFVVSNFIPAMQEVGSWLQAHVLPILQHIGGFLLSTFTPVWKQLVEVWNSSILPSLKQLWAALVPLSPVLKLVGEVILGLVMVAFALLTGILKGVVQGLAGLLSGLAVAVAGIVKLFTGIVQVISGIVQFLMDLLTGHFSKLKGDLATIWAGIVNIFSGAWLLIEGIFKAAWGTISGFVSGLVSGVIGFFQHLAATLVGHSIIPDMINSIVGWFLSLPGRALSAVSSLLGRLAGFFGGLAGQALSWGLSIVRNVASGILNGIGSFIGNALNAVGTFISSHMPHSPAERGPLKDLALQGSKISEQIALGMLAGMPHIQNALNGILTPVSVGVGVSGGLAQASMSRISGGTGQQIIVQPPDIYLDGVRLSQQLMPHIHKRIVYGVGGFGGFGRA